MKNNSTFGILFLIMLLFLSLSCSPHGTSNVTIHINLGLNNASAVNTLENTIFDKIFRLFTKDAEAQSAPSHITSLELNVTGSGMENIHQTYTSPDIPASITLEVTSGPSRLFEVLASSASATLRGAVTQSLVGGTTATIPISMALSQVRIVLPDFSNYRIVQINDLPLQLTSPVWIPKDGSSTVNGLYLSTISVNNFRPYDIDFDSQGRIYIANNFNVLADGGIIRIGDINDTVPEKINNTVNMVALAVDRVNRMIYFVDGSQLYRCNDYNCSSIKNDFTMGAINLIRGIDITDSGLLLIAQSNSFTIYDPNQGNGTIINSLPYTGVSASEAWDMSAKGARIYGAFFDTGGPSFIVEFSLNASNQLVQTGIYNTTLYGPHRFIKSMLDMIYFNDENFASDRLVSIDNISGAGRVNYGSNGNAAAGVGRFDFFN